MVLRLQHFRCTTWSSLYAFRLMKEGFLPSLERFQGFVNKTRSFLELQPSPLEKGAGGWLWVVLNFRTLQKGAGCHVNRSLVWTDCPKTLDRVELILLSLAHPLKPAKKNVDVLFHSVFGAFAYPKQLFCLKVPSLHLVTLMIEVIRAGQSQSARSKISFSATLLMEIMRNNSVHKLTDSVCHPFETSGSTDPTTQRHFQENANTGDSNFQCCLWD